MTVIYSNDFLLALFQGRIAIGTDTIKGMLLSDAYEPSATHTRRNQLTDEIAGTGYTAGGITLTLTATYDATGKFLLLTRPAAVWNAALSAKHLALYKARGGAATADEVLWVEQFPQMYTSTNTFTVQPTTITHTLYS